MAQEISLTTTAGRLPVEFTATVSGPEVRGRVDVQALSGWPQTFVVSFHLDAAAEFEIQNTKVTIEFSAADMHALYHPYGSVQGMSMLPFWGHTDHSSATQPPPFWCFLHQSGRNRLAFGLADQLTPTRLDYKCSEHTRTIRMQAVTPAEGTLRRSAYAQHVLVSFAEAKLATMLEIYRRFVDEHQPQEVLPVPECAYDPVFCTWTAIHTDVTPQWTQDNAAIAMRLGFKTLLMDDGWMDWPSDAPDERVAGGVSYPFLGEWRPNAKKFSDFAGHVQRIHALGMRYMLWVAPFFMGELSALHPRFADKGFKCPRDRRPGGNTMLDPRYPEVADYVRSTLLRLVRDYRLDGLKIDFVDGVASRTESHMAPLPPGRTEGGPALQELLGGVVDELRKDVPDLMIECRQGYSNLAARRWTNCYRSPDVPLNLHQNRFNCAMLRLLVPDRAVYFDPALWPMDDPVENVARQMISAVACVPMISIELDRYPQAHLDVVGHWIGFYEAHRGTLVHGGFEPMFRLGHNPMTTFTGKDETIIGLYDDHAFVLDDPGHPLFILNASSRPLIDIVHGTLRGPRMVDNYSRTGRLIGRQRLTFPVSALAVEVGGYIEVLSPGR